MIPESIRNEMRRLEAEPDWLRDAPPVTEAPVNIAPIVTAPQSIRARLGARTLDMIPATAPDPLLIDRLEPHDHTILYGPGGIGKGTLAAHYIVQLVRAGHRVMILDYESHPDEWSPRIAGLGPDIDTASILHVPTLGAEWGGTRGPLWNQTDDIRALVDDFRATYLVVDSIVFACVGHDSQDSMTPILYGSGLERIGLPTLSIGHVTKATDLRYPFGSVFWHNGCRLSWSLSEAPGGNGRVLLKNRKANKRKYLGAYLVAITWHADMPREVWEQAYKVALADEMAEALRDGPLTDRALTARLNEGEDDEAPRVKLDSVQAALRRGLGSTPRRFRKDGDLWALED